MSTKNRLSIHHAHYYTNVHDNCNYKRLTSILFKNIAFLPSPRGCKILISTSRQIVSAPSVCTKRSLNTKFYVRSFSYHDGKQVHHTYPDLATVFLEMDGWMILILQTG